MDFQNRVAVITGGGRGIGRAIAQAFARHGAGGVVIGYRDDTSSAQKTVELLGEAGVPALSLSGDIAKPATSRALAKAALDRFGRLDAWVNNAGITADGPFLRMPEDRWRLVLNTNLEGTRHGCQAALEVMFRQRSGAIVNVASVIGLIGNSGQANYSAAKAAIIGLTRSLAVDFGRRGIRINAVAPGYVPTALTEEVEGEAQRVLLSHIPLAKAGRPEDVAELTVFLCSERAAYITGATIVVDGGLTAGERLMP